MTVILSELSIVSIVIPYVRVCRSRRNPDDRTAECNFATHKRLLPGLDYLHWQTGYLGLPEGTDNRINFYGIYTF